MEELNKNDIDIMARVLHVPLGAFGREEFLRRVDLSEAKIIDIVKFLDHSDNIKGLVSSLTPTELEELSNVFIQACIIADPLEIQTLIGFSWSEAMETYEKLFKYIRSSRRNT